MHFEDLHLLVLCIYNLLTLMKNIYVSLCAKRNMSKIIWIFKSMLYVTKKYHKKCLH